jgi:transcriptional regulator with XRE-family HTH domain
MITGDQIRAARAFLKWSAKDLAARAGVGISTVQRMEKTSSVPNASGINIEAVQKTLESAGIEIIPANGGGPGVRLRARPLA